MSVTPRLVLAVLALGAAAALGAPGAAQGQHGCAPGDVGVKASLQLKEPVPTGLVYSSAPGATPRLSIILQLRFCGGDFLTVDGTRDADYARRLFFKRGNTTIPNTTEFLAHDAERWCMHVNQTPLQPAAPVVALEVIPAGTVLEYTVDDARTAYDLREPGSYSVVADISLLATTPAALITSCDELPGETLVNVMAGTNVPVTSNTLEFGVAGAAPTTALTAQAPAPNANGWNKDDVTLSFAATDTGGGGVRSITAVVNGVERVFPGSTASVTIATAGTSTVSYFATNNAGNRETPPPPITIRLDKTPPSLACSQSPAANADGWNKTGPVTVSVSASDTGSGIDVGPATVPPVTADGVTPITRTATDKAGNTASVTCTVRIDGGAPSIAFGARTPAANAAGWNNTNVSIAFTATDAVSGVDKVVVPPPGTATISGGSAAGSVVLTTEGAAVTASVSATDKAGNTATAASPPVKIDKTPPGVTCSVSPSSLWPPNHKLVPVTVTVRVTDALSGPAGFKLVSVVSSERDAGLGDGDVPNDIQGFVVGTDGVKGSLRAERAANGSGRVYTLTYQGLDAAGNAKTCVTTVKVPHDQGKD